MSHIWRVWPTKTNNSWAKHNRSPCQKGSIHWAVLAGGKFIHANFMRNRKKKKNHSNVPCNTAFLCASVFAIRFLVIFFCFLFFNIFFFYNKCWIFCYFNIFFVFFFLSLFSAFLTWPSSFFTFFSIWIVFYFSFRFVLFCTFSAPCFCSFHANSIQFSSIHSFSANKTAIF